MASCQEYEQQLGHLLNFLPLCATLTLIEESSFYYSRLQLQPSYICKNSELFFYAILQNFTPEDNDGVSSKRRSLIIDVIVLC